MRFDAAEANLVVLHAWIPIKAVNKVIAIRAARQTCVIGPVTATQNVVASRRRAVRVGAARIWRAIPIPAPFHNIARHVIKSISVRSKRTNRAGVRLWLREGGI